MLEWSVLRWERCLFVHSFPPWGRWRRSRRLQELRPHCLHRHWLNRMAVCSSSDLCWPGGRHLADVGNTESGRQSQRRTCKGDQWWNSVWSGSGQNVLVREGRLLDNEKEWRLLREDAGHQWDATRWSYCRRLVLDRLKHRRRIHAGL